MILSRDINVHVFIVNKRIMYAKFKISKASMSTVRNKFPNEHYSIYDYILQNRSKSIFLEALKLDYYELLDGSKVQEFYFPSKFDKPFDVFISHSHADITEARYLATYLEKEKGLRCFIDSIVWDNVLDLVDNVVEQFGYRNEHEYYNIVKHVNMMLSMAITQMIDSTECCIFLETENSIFTKGEVKTGTYSPWLYQEIGLMNVLRQQELTRSRHFVGTQFMLNDSYCPTYNIDISKFYQLQSSDLLSDKKGTDWLNWLYDKNTMIYR